MIKGEPPGTDTGTSVDHGRPRPDRLDKETKQIIGLLQQDGRAAYEEIGRQVGMDALEVERRVARLRQIGLIQITAVSDPLQLGFARQAMLGVAVHPDHRTSAVSEAVCAIPEVCYVVRTAGGEFDLLVEVVGESDAQLLELVARIRPLPGVATIHTFLYRGLDKQTYTWGTR